MKSKKQWFPFILLNIIVSAVTVVVVLYVWDRINPSQDLTLPYTQTTAVNDTQVSPVGTLPALDEETVKITNVIAAGDYQNEYVVLSRVGEGALNLSGWVLVDMDQHRFVFPDINLIKGDLEIYSKGGMNTVNKLFWNAGEAVWQSGETVTLIDSAAQMRASFEIP